MFALRKIRQTDAPLREVLEAIGEVTNQEFASDKEMLTYFQQTMNSQGQLTLLDLVYFSSYESKIGFRYNLEALNGLEGESDKIWQVMSSIVPPASPYQEANKSMFAAFPFSYIDWESKVDHI